MGLNQDFKLPGSDLWPQVAPRELALTALIPNYKQVVPSGTYSAEFLCKATDTNEEIGPQKKLEVATVPE
jgi:hypothetical protein